MLALIMSAAMVLSACDSVAQGLVVPITVNAANVADQPSAWAVEHINAAVAAGLVPDTLRGSYQTPATRAEFAAFAVTLYEVATGREITERMTFNDTADINVQKMGGLGVVTGVGNGNFNPEGTLTREQAAVMLARLADVARHPLPIAPNNAFADNGQISTWAYQAIGQMQMAGIMGGTGNNMFSPQGHYTREQSIVTILRLYELLEVAQASNFSAGNPGTTFPPIETPAPNPIIPPLTLPEPTPQPPTAPLRQFNMNDPNVQLIPNYANARTSDELRALEEARLGIPTGGWRSAVEIITQQQNNHPDYMIGSQTFYEWRMMPIRNWVNGYLATNGISVSNMTDYQKTAVIRRIIEDGKLEEFIGLWRPNFRFTQNDCVPRAEAIRFLMIAMDFELIKTINGWVERFSFPAHSWNAYWCSTAGAIRFVDEDLRNGVWNTFADELDALGFALIVR